MELHEYQKFAWKHLVDHPHSALFLDMGLGKTIITLTALDYLLYRELDVRKVLVMAPKRVAEKVWIDEKNLWPHTRHLKMIPVVGSAEQRLQALHKEGEIYLISRDNIVWLCNHFGRDPLPFDMLVVDEFSSIKSPRAKRFKALKKRQAEFKRVVGLTGTPAPNGLIDLWTQLWMLDRGKRLGRTLTAYRDEYFKPGKRNGMIVYEWKPRKGAEDQIHKQIGDICISMKSADFLDLTPPEHNTIKVYLPPKIQKEYLSFEEELVLSLKDSEEPITAVNAAVLTNKLLQFANGAIYGEDRKVHLIHDEKLKALDEIIEDSLGQPVLVAWAYQHDRDRILHHLQKHNPRELKTGKDIDDWNRGEIPVMLTHPASGGHGLNLQRGGNIIVWFGQTWSLELYQQLNRRLDRQGQTQTVTIHHLITKDTMDEDVAAAIHQKTRKQDALLNAVKARIEKYG